MRAAVLCLLAVGCGKPAALPVPSVPAPTTEARTDNDSLYEHYWRKAPLFERHPQEGKRIVIAVDRFFAVPESDAAGAPCILLHAYDSVKRPKVVLQMAGMDDVRLVMNGGTKYVEGTLRGAVEFSEHKPAAKWAQRAPHPLRMPDHFVLVEDCKAVQP
jgi:hypothetical protein